MKTFYLYSEERDDASFVVRAETPEEAAEKIREHTKDWKQYVTYSGVGDLDPSRLEVLEDGDVLSF